MASFLFTIIFAIIVAYFSTQNTEAVSIHFQQYSWSHIPLYLVMLFSLLVGALFAWILHLLQMYSLHALLRTEREALQETKQVNIEMSKRIHELELENDRLSTPEDEAFEENSL